MEGLWTVEFGSNAGSFGSGVVVLRNGTIEGGDGSYYYLGSYQTENPRGQYPLTFRARLKITPFLPNAESVFKTFDKDFTLDLEGTFKDENSAVAVGTPEGIPGMNLGVRLIRRKEA